MVQINFARAEVVAKLVYYGPGFAGKTTNLQAIHAHLPPDARGAFTSIQTNEERTLFFDFMAIAGGTVAGLKTKFLLYTVPGQVYYAETRRLVLQGADGVVFVADSARDRLGDNAESAANLAQDLKAGGFPPGRIPVVYQYNKRDAADALPIPALAATLNPEARPEVEAVAVRGEGVLETLGIACRMVLERLNGIHADTTRRPGP